MLFETGTKNGVRSGPPVGDSAPEDCKREHQMCYDRQVRTSSRSSPETGPRVPYMKRSLAFLLCMLLAVPLRVAGAEAGHSPDWSDVSGIFVERCVMCHSAQGAALGLRLDTYEAALAGSSNGAVLVRGQAERSELIRRLRGESRPRMPLLSYPLPDDQIELIMQWVDAGLPEDE